MKIKPINFFLEGILNVRLKRLLILTICLTAIGVANLQAQTKSITGTLKDEIGEPLPGATVLIQGTTNGTMTDIDGHFTVEAKSGDVLVFSSVGMEGQNVTVGSSNVINLTMKDAATMLIETVVIGYGSARKRDLTGSIATIKASDIANKPSANPLASLQGKVAGIQVINSGRAGQDPEIRMRGTNSVNGYKPLYVVDGLFTDNINYLNTTDIENMEILKDPSSLAIFGIRGANGVIIISTKKAKQGQTIVNINSSIGWKNISDRVDLTNAAQFKELYNEQLSTQQLANPDVRPFDYTNWQADTDWQDEMFQTGFMSNNSVSITGSGEKNKFYLSIGYATEEGSIKSEEFSKVTINLNSDYQISKSLKVGYQVNGSRMLPPDAKMVGGLVRAAPIAPVYKNWVNPVTKQTEQLLHMLPSFQNAQVWNPMVEVDFRGNHNLGVNHRAAGNIYGELNFLKDFTFRTTYSLDYAIEEGRQASPLVYAYNPDNTGMAAKEYIELRQSVNQKKSTMLTAQSDYILTYDKKLGLHSLNATAGVTTNYREYSLLNARRSEHIDDVNFLLGDNPDKWWLESMGDVGSQNQYEKDTRYQWKRFTMSYLVRALYSYNNRYLFNASYRRDGSSVFRGSDNTWDNFYSFGGGWVVSEENFMKGQKIVDYLKLKGSYGVLGSENIGTNANLYYPTYPALVNTSSVVFGDRIIPMPSKQYFFQNLKWEKTYSWELGLDMNFLNQRLRVEPVYYSKTTKDIIVLLGSQGGAQNALKNIGDIENKGFELSTSWNDKIGETGFTYGFSGNLTTIKNNVVKLGGDAITDGVSRTAEGNPIGYFYGYTVEGIYQNKQDIINSPTNMVYPVLPGDLKFKDVNQDGKIDQNDRGMIGNPTPDLTYGFSMNLGYKNFDFGIDFMGVYGNEVYRSWDASSFAQFNYLTKRMDRWNGEGTSNWEPILDPGRAINTNAHSSYFIEDGSFLRLRNIQLGYTFDSSLLQKIYLKSVRLYGNIQNLKTWSKTSGYTPEIGGSATKFGIDDGTYPMPAIYTMGVNITF